MAHLPTTWPGGLIVEKSGAGGCQRYNRDPPPPSIFLLTSVLMKRGPSRRNQFPGQSDGKLDYFTDYSSFFSTPRHINKEKKKREKIVGRAKNWIDDSVVEKKAVSDFGRRGLRLI